MSKTKDLMLASANVFVSEPGDPMVPDYRPVLHEDGQIELVQIGEHSLYDEIQAYKDAVDINNLVSRYCNGELDVLNQVPAYYADVSMYPTNLADATKMVRKAREEFESLDFEKRSAFASFEDFCLSAGSEEWLSVMGFGNSINSRVDSTNSGDSNKEVSE